MNQQQSPLPPFDLAGAVAEQVAAWQRWVASWQLQHVRTKSRVCANCVSGAQFVMGAAFDTGVPHPVKHALVSRMHRVANKRLSDVVEVVLPEFHREQGRYMSSLQSSEYDPRASLAPEYDGVELDPLPAANEPFLFTLEEFAAASTAGEEPPFEFLIAGQSPQQQQRLARAKHVRDVIHYNICKQLATGLVSHRAAIKQTLETHVTWQVEADIARLMEHLETPDIGTL